MMRNRFADTFYELAQGNPNLHLIVADISPAGSIEKFRVNFPHRFLNVGVAEQSMIGIAAGMAMRSLRVFVYTIATFALYRPFEMVRDDLAYQNLPVTVVGIGGGLTYSTLGATHHAHEDIAIATAIPNMQVIAPCDPGETHWATQWCAVESEKPTYLRLGKAGEPELTGGAGAEPWEFGQIRYLYRGPDVCILSYGPIMSLAKEVADALREKGYLVSLVSVHTLKPLDRLGIVEALKLHSRTIVIEETSGNYGLGIQVRALAQAMRTRASMDTFGLADEFIHCYGSHKEILAAHGLSVEKIMERLWWA